MELFARLFEWMWIGAAITSIYFLYVALASAASWSNLHWSVGAGLVAKFLAVVLNRNKQRVDYGDQLIERGYSKGKAEEAWRIADSGGLNLLRNSQQTELNEQIDRLETAINTLNGEGDSA